jgi:hypothetical protein
MAENLNIPPSRFNALSLRRLAERKNIERIFGATAAILATNAVKYLLSLNLVSGWFSYDGRDFRLIQVRTIRENSHQCLRRRPYLRRV